MKRSLLFLIILTKCTFYEMPNESCKVMEYYNVDGREYRRCYQ